MIKIISKNIKQSQSWLDEIRDVDWGKDSKPEPDWPPGSINDDNLSNYLVDDLEPINNTPQQINNPNLSKNPQNIQQPINFLDEIPRGSTELGIPEDTPEIEYASSQQLINDGIQKRNIISFEYTNRYGDYAGLRTVEPHYTFIASSTGNEVLVTFDLDVSDIRAFIVGNIHPNGVRYDGIEFQLRPEIMVGIS